MAKREPRLWSFCVKNRVWNLHACKHSRCGHARVEEPTRYSRMSVDAPDDRPQ